MGTPHDGRDPLMTSEEVAQIWLATDLVRRAGVLSARKGRSAACATENETLRVVNRGYAGPIPAHTPRISPDAYVQVRWHFHSVELRGFEPLTFSLRRLPEGSRGQAETGSDLGKLSM